MAGHSKWSNIKHRKNRQDAKRGKIFTKLIREITVATCQKGSDPSSNSRLRLAIDKALSNNMPRDTIERAIKRGSNVLSGNASDIEEVRYEGYGPCGVAILINCMTDNRKRTVGEVRHILTRSGGNLGTDGSVSYLFKQYGLFGFAAGADEEKIMQIALDNEAEDVISNDDGSIEVLTTPDNFVKVKEVFEKEGLVPDNAEITMIASTKVELNKEQSEKVVKLLEALDDLEDVQNVYSNADIVDEVFESIK